MTMPFIDHQLTEREKALVWAANQDPVTQPDGVFRIDTDSYQCDVCGSRIPHNAKPGYEHVSDFYVTQDEAILCRTCADEEPESVFELRADPPPTDVEPGRGNF